MNNDIKEILFTKEQIQRRVFELGQVIAGDYQGKAPVMVGILKGGVPFLAD